MPYIGKQPLTGAYQLCDTITTSATATYNLLVGGSAVIPGSANNCIVSLNGVIQAPVGAFTVSGSQITFASALTSSDVIDFILILGNVFDIGTPSNGAVTNSSLNSNVITGQTAETTVAGGDLVLLYDDSASALRKMTRTNFVSGLSNTPAFLAYLSADQSISNGVQVKAQFNTEVFDVGGCYDNATNYRFTPNVAGKYMVFSNLLIQLNDYGIYNASIEPFFNGSQYTFGNNLFGTGANLSICMYVSQIISFNGTTDYVEIFGSMERHTSSGNRFDSGNKSSYFGAYKIIE